jgi:hypothetical protein
MCASCVCTATTVGRDSTSGRAGGRVPDDVAHLLLERNDVQPYDSGLFPGHPQSWRLGNWREALDRIAEP